MSGIECPFGAGAHCDKGDSDKCSTVLYPIQEGQYETAEQLGITIQELYGERGAEQGIYPYVKLCQSALKRPDVIKAVADMSGDPQPGVNDSVEQLVSMDNYANRLQATKTLPVKDIDVYNGIHFDED